MNAEAASAKDPVLHSAPRIEIVGRLVLHEHLRFAALCRLTGMTGGTLSSHLAMLERAGYVVQRDAILQLRPGKLVALTPRGRDAFRTHVEALDALLGRLRGLRGTAVQKVASSGAKAAGED